MLGISPVSICLYFSVRCCAKQKYWESIRRKIVFNKLSAVPLKDCDFFRSFKTFATMRDYSNGTVKNGSIEERSADNVNSQVCNGR